MKTLSKDELLAELRRMLADLFEQHQRGAQGAKLARAHGYLDGYMRGAVESGLLTSAELLTLVRDQREVSLGPAVAQVELETQAA